MVNWSGTTPKERDNRKRDLHIGELLRERRARRRLQILKAKLDLYGLDSLNQEEREIVRLFPDYFYPEEG